MKYTRSSELGLVWAGTTSVRKAYEWDPATLIDGVGERDVHGVEAPLWSETIETRKGLDHLAFPRLLGVAEIGWSRCGRALVARLPKTSWRVRPSARRARRGFPPGARGAVGGAGQRRPVIEPRPVFSAASGHAPQ